MLTVGRLSLPERFWLVEIIHNPWLFDGKWVTQSMGLVACKRGSVGIRFAKGGLYEVQPLNMYGGGRSSTTPAVQLNKKNKET